MGLFQSWGGQSYQHAFPPPAPNLCTVRAAAVGQDGGPERGPVPAPAGHRHHPLPHRADARGGGRRLRSRPPSNPLSPPLVGILSASIPGTLFSTLAQMLPHPEGEEEVAGWPAGCVGVLALTGSILVPEAESPEKAAPSVEVPRVHAPAQLSRLRGCPRYGHHPPLRSCLSRQAAIDSPTLAAIPAYSGSSSAEQV